MPTISSFDWEKGSWKADPASSHSNQETAKVCIAGDWAPVFGLKEFMATHHESVYGDVLPILRKADLSITNLEAPLSDRGDPVYKSGAVFKGESCHQKTLNAVPFSAVTMANNHVFDYGLDAFKDTVDGLNQNNIQWTGAGLSLEEAKAPLLIDVNNIKIAIVNFSEGEDLTAAGEGPGVMGWELSMVEDTIKELRPKVDFIIVISHCGIEYIPFPPPYVASAFKQMAEAGADVVIGHHPHVPQGIQFYNNTPICYSLGNFVFSQETDLKYRKLGYLVNLEFNKDSLSAMELVPYKINDRGISLVKDSELQLFREKFKEISLPLKKEKNLNEAWHGFLHYYGVNGFFNEISMITEMMKTEPEKGAAMFRNRLTTLQHYNHWKDFMTHIVEGKLESSPQWPGPFFEEWMTSKADWL
ncbi:MAG: CapA family protein [Thermodesulfobacteriota bacterium]